MVAILVSAPVAVMLMLIDQSNDVRQTLNFQGLFASNRAASQLLFSKNEYDAVRLNALSVVLFKLI